MGAFFAGAFLGAFFAGAFLGALFAGAFLGAFFAGAVFLAAIVISSVTVPLPARTRQDASLRPTRCCVQEW